MRVPKPRLWKSAPSSEQSAALSHRPKGQCSHAHSAPPLPKNLTSLRFSGALLSHTCGFLGKSEFARFLIGEALIIRVSRKSQGAARDFWERGETVPQRLRIAFRQTAATRVLFRRARREKNKGEAAAGKPCGGEHLVVSPITEKSFVFQNFFRESTIFSQKAEPRFLLWRFSIIKLRAQKSHFLQAHSICRNHSAEWKRVNFGHLYNNQTARSKATPLEKRPQFAAYLRLSRKE